MADCLLRGLQAAEKAISMHPLGFNLLYPSPPPVFLFFMQWQPDHASKSFGAALRVKGRPNPLLFKPTFFVFQSRSCPTGFLHSEDSPRFKSHPFADPFLSFPSICCPLLFDQCTVPRWSHDVVQTSLLTPSDLPSPPFFASVELPMSRGPS